MALPIESDDMEVGDDAQQATVLLQKPSGSPRRRSPWLVPAVCLAATGVLALASGAAKAVMPAPARAPLNRVTGLAEDAPTEVARIQWEPSPDWCIIVGGGDDEKPGVAPELWKCNSDHDMFIVPAPGTKGLIKWAKHPNLCLNSPRDSQLQLWHCDKAPVKNLEFMMPENGSGPIELASRPGTCVIVPDSEKKNGMMLKMGNCSAEDTDFRVDHCADFAGGELVRTACHVQNVVNAKLTATEEIHNEFIQGAKGGFAKAIGGGAAPDHVGITTTRAGGDLAGSSIDMEVVISLEEGASGNTIQRNALRLAVKKSLNAWPNLENVTMGPIAVSCEPVVTI